MFALFVIIIALVALVLYCGTSKPKNFPSGPKWYPIIGSALKIAAERKRTGMLSSAVNEIGIKYGKNGVVGMKVGKDNIVFANNADAIKEMSLNEDLDGRPKGIFYETRTFNERCGIIFTDEELWKDNRRFLVRHLKEFGFARRGMLDICEIEAEHMLEDYKHIVDSQNGKAMIEMQDTFNVYTLNTLWKMVAGKRYNRYEPEIKELQDLLYILFSSVDMVGCLFSHFPFLRFIAPNYSGYNPFVKTHEMLYKFLNKELEKHKEKVKVENEASDYMDVFLQVLQSEEKKENFTEKQLLAIILDMFVAGSETTTKTLNIAYLNIIAKPSVQKKLQHEIDMVVGRDRLPVIEDRQNMPYCQAVILESLRFFMGNTMGIAHRALRDTKLRGFDIPQDTIVIGNYGGMLMDETFWKDAKTFHPERFLQNGKTVIPENFDLFGLGTRRCLGETIAKLNLFVFITTLFQHFDFLIPSGHPAPRLDLIDGATPSVRQYTALVQYRSILDKNIY